MSKLPVILVTGFLGAGKTTFINKLLNYINPRNTKVALLINEFGSINIDTDLIEEDRFIKYEVNQGSIFCTCTRDQFISALDEISNTEPAYDCIIIEATGIAETTSLAEYLNNPPLTGKIKISQNYCLIDAVNFHKVLETLPAAKNQVKSASICIINKIDLITDNKLKELETQIYSLNKDAIIVKASFGKIDFESLLSLDYTEEKVNSNLKKYPPQAIYTITLNAIGIFNFNCIKSFLEEITEQLYRVKGFLNFAGGVFYVEWTGTEWKYTKTDKDIVNNQLVLIGKKLNKKALQKKFENCLNK